MKKLTILLLLALTTHAFSANVLRQAKEAIKKKQNLEATAKNLLAEAAKPETKHADRVECYVLAAECWKRVNEAENMKLYLKQKYDTAKFFSSIQQMFSLLEKADSLEMQPNEKGRQRFVYRRRNHDSLLPYRKNVFDGGIWYYRKMQMNEAIPYFQTYLSSSETSLFKDDNFYETDTLMPYVSYLTVHAAQITKQPSLIIQYAPLALKANTRPHIIQEYLAKAYIAEGDTANYLKAMWQGVQSYPEHIYFFSNLVDDLIAKREYERGLELTDSMIQLQDTMALFHYAKSLLLLKLHRDEDAIKAADECIKLDSTYADAYYNKGIATLNLAVIYSETACTDLNNPQCKRDREMIRSLYLLAKEPMEHVRLLQPENKERWAAPLYRIYLHLNMGKEFDEMDKLLNAK